MLVSWSVPVSNRNVVSIQGCPLKPNNSHIEARQLAYKQSYTHKHSKKHDNAHTNTMHRFPTFKKNYDFQFVLTSSFRIKIAQSYVSHALLVL